MKERGNDVPTRRIRLSRSRRRVLGLALLVVAACPAERAGAASAEGPRVLHVGPHGAFPVPSAAAEVARAGDVIEIAAGDYPGDTAIWRANGLILRGVNGQARLDAAGVALPERKAIWVIKGDDVRIENVEFAHAHSPDRNGAGIRSEGAGLTVSHCYFHDNEEGILAGRKPDSDILIEHSEFARNGHADGQAHNIYIGEVRSFTLQFSYVHHANIGSQVKSRAAVSKILYNRIMDESDGRGNYNIDLSNGGLVLLIGNLLQQGKLTENKHMVAFAPEGAKRGRQELYVVNNTFVNERSSGRFIINHSANPARIYNNLFVGSGDVVYGPAVLAGNVMTGQPKLAAIWQRLRQRDDTPGGADGRSGNSYADEPGLLALTRYDYRLRPGSAAIDHGVDPGVVDGMSLRPVFEYVHPAAATRRDTRGLIDAGAYEFDPDEH